LPKKFEISLWNWWFICCWFFLNFILEWRLRFAQHWSGIHERTCSGLFTSSSFRPRRFVIGLPWRRQCLCRIFLCAHYPLMKNLLKKFKTENELKLRKRFPFPKWSSSLPDFFRPPPKIQRVLRIGNKKSSFRTLFVLVPRLSIITSYYN
jgi:hypothetical protein